MNVLLFVHLATSCSTPTLLHKAHRPEAWHHGRASVYSDPQPVAGGGRLDVRALTCASNIVPLGRRVEFKRGGRKVTATVNDVMPAYWKRRKHPRHFDFTPATGGALGFTDGVADVDWRVVGRPRNHRRMGR